MLIVSMLDATNNPYLHSVTIGHACRLWSIKPELRQNMKKKWEKRTTKKYEYTSIYIEWDDIKYSLFTWFEIKIKS